jgi:ketosteroid isomerase-like protein
MHPNAELIRKFYTAFASRDARAMAACYHPSVRFSDEVFIDLQGARQTQCGRCSASAAKT